MAGNTMTLEFAGDASKLQQAAKKAQAATDDVAAAAKNAGADYDKAGDASDRYGKKMGDIGSAATGALDSLDALGGGLQAVADVQNYAQERAQRLARAANDVKQAMEDQEQAVRDASQALIDGDQASVDLEQAQLDAATAQREYNAAVKEHGKDSDEARQAMLDMKQAGVDVKQAQEDSEQALRDQEQAAIDAEGAQLDLIDAQKESNPSGLQEWADKLAVITPLLSAVMGATALVTLAQWAWNLAQLASPTTWIILGVLALVAVIVLIAKKTDWFSDAWKAAWKWIKSAASNTWDWLKKVPGWIGTAFAKVAGFITAPFRWAFNFVADAWNNTIGQLSWTVPGWIPGIGGNSISVPHLPKFHSGGTVPGAPGSEMLAILQAGETVTPAGGGGSGAVTVVVKLDSDVLIESTARAVRRRGGNVQFVLGGAHA